MREKVQFPALNKTYNLKTRTELIEVDYLDKLNDSEKDFLNRFQEEFVNANFKHPGKKLHRTQKFRKERYDANNARNRCQYTTSKASGGLFDLDHASKSLALNAEELLEQDRKIQTLTEIAKIVKVNKDLKKKSQNWYKKGYSVERILRKLKQLNNLDNSTNCPQNSKNSAKKKH